MRLLFSLGAGHIAQIRSGTDRYKKCMEDTSMDIMEILKNAGVEIPDDKREMINTELRKAYKHSAEVGKITERHKTEVDSLSEQLKTANAEIESYKGMDIEGIKKSADEYRLKTEQMEKDHKAAAEKAEADYNAKIADMQYDSVLKDSLAGEKFSSDYARQGIFNDIKSKKLPIENGAIMGLQDTLKVLRESSPDAFAPGKPPATFVSGVAGGTPITATPKEEAVAAAQVAMGIKLPKG